MAQVAFKARLRPLLREVATAFPNSGVELWAVAVNEQRLGIKPLRLKIWCVDRQHPLTLVQLPPRIARASTSFCALPVQAQVGRAIRRHLTLTQRQPFILPPSAGNGR